MNFKKVPRAGRLAAALVTLLVVAAAAIPLAAGRDRAPQELTVLYLFSGATDDGLQGAGGKEATAVHCTNYSAQPLSVEVQILNYDGAMYSSTAEIGSDDTYTFSTQATALFFDDVFIGGSPGTPAIFQGAGRVLAGGRDVICTAQVLDPTGYPPAYLDKLALHRADGNLIGDPYDAFLPLLQN
jgi:hypothetical protein